MKPTKDSKKNRIYALFGLLLVFLLAVDFVLFATGTITLSKPENDTSTTEEITTEDYSKYIDRETWFITLQNHVYYYPDGYPGEYYTGWYKKQVVNPQVSQAFLQLMLNQQRTEKIPAGLPEGTKCANKTGEMNFTQHDAAIVYSPNATYIIVVMSTDCGAAIGNIRDISKVTYDYFNPGTKEDLTYKTLLRD